MPIQPFHAPMSTVDAVGKALGVIRDIYGIKQAGAAQDMLAAQQAQLEQKTGIEKTQFDQSQKAFDPSSPESQAMKAQDSMFVKMISKKNPDEAQPLLDMTKDPSISGGQLRGALETSPLSKYFSSMSNKDAALEWMARSQDIRNQNTQEKTSLSANKQYDSTMKPYEGTAQALNRADSIINDIKSGDLKSTKLLRTDLTSALGSAFNQGKGATVYSMSHSDVDTAYGRLNTFLSNYSGKPMNTIPPEMLDQVQKDVQALKATYADAHEVAYSSFREGLPDRLKSSLDNRFNKFREKSGLGSANLESSGAVSKPKQPIQSGPKVGDIEDGHKFKGGNPADPNSWELVK